jgi:hypothetical protein
MSPNDGCDEPSLVLGRLSVWVLEKAYPESLEEWYDGTLLRVWAECSAPGSRVTVSGHLLDTNNIGHLLAGMEAMYSWEGEAAEMTPYEPRLGIRLTRGSRGDVRIEEKITPDYTAQEHRFFFDADLTYLPEPIRQCRDVLQKFPVAQVRSYPLPRPP